MNSEKLLPIRVLIIGCGDLGQRLAARLPVTRYQVTGLRRTPPPDTAYVKYQACDVTHAHSLDQEIASGYDIILVTMTPSERSDEGYRQAYVQTCAQLVASLKKYQAPGLIIYVSSTSVYGQQDGSWVDENSPTQPESYNGKRLLEAENILRDSGLRHCIVRFSGIYGPGRSRLIDQVRQGRAVLSASYTNRIHADDCAGVLAHFIELQSRNTQLESLYIASDATPAPLAEVVNWLSMQLKVNTAVFAPQRLDREGGNKRCSNQRLLNSGYKLLYPGYIEGYTALLQLPV